MLDWWFDIDNRICCVKLNERKKGEPAVFDGDIRVHFDGFKLLRSGITYIYKTNDGHVISINDVKFRGERYVSLYCDGAIIKEYNVLAEKYKEKYNNSPDKYDYPRKHLRALTLSAFAAAFFFAAIIVSVMSAFKLFNSLPIAAVTYAAISIMIFAFSASVASFNYSHTRNRMENYALVSSIPDSKKKKITHKKTRRKKPQA